MLIPEKIIRSKRKTLSLQINENGQLIVRVPRFIPDIEIYKFINKHKKWIEEKSQEILIKKDKLKLYNFYDGEEFLFLGERFTLKIINSTLFNKKSGLCYFDNKNLIVRTNNKSKTIKLIEDFYKEQARSIIEQRVNFYLKLLNDHYGTNYSYRKIKLTNGRKNIGSCSPKGDLNFSWRIIQAPVDIIDYVIVHELVHLKYRHHKKTFWLSVSKFKPNYKRNIEWIKENWFYLREFLRNEKALKH